MSNTQNHWNRLARATLIGFLAVLSACTDPLPNPKETTGQLEVLGNPFLEKPEYARNVWDMQVFDGRIYFGHGDAIANTGDTNVFSYNPSTSKFRAEFTVNDEEIHEFNILDNQLFIPGYDPLEAWDLGNFYKLEQGAWQKHRTIPWGVHAYQLRKFDNKLFVSIGTDLKHPGLLSSSDNGKTWDYVSNSSLNARRFNKLFDLGGTLYAAGNLGKGLVKLEQNLFDDAKISLEQITPGLTSSTGILMDKLEPFKNGVIFSAGNILALSDNPAEDRFERFGQAVFFTTNFQDTVRIPTPANSTVMDILVRDNTVYLLTTQKFELGFENKVLQSTNAITWTQTMKFSSNSLARSFELLNSKFYFGLGCFFVWKACASNGQILRHSP